MNHSKIMSGLLMVALFAFSASVAFSQAAPAEATKPDAASLTENVLTACAARASRRCNSLDYDGRAPPFKELAGFSRSSAGPQFLAATIWLQTLNESRRLQASLYSTEGFYANTKTS